MLRNNRGQSDRFARMHGRLNQSQDGTREAGLVFVIVFLLGAAVAATLVPGSLTSFWTWFILFLISVALALITEAVLREKDKTED